MKDYQGDKALELNKQVSKLTDDVKVRDGLLAQMASETGAEILRLRAEAERVKAENEWIPCETRLPEETKVYEKIIAINLGGDFVPCTFYKGNFYANGQIAAGVKAWYLLPNYKTIYLPAAPEEGE